MCNFTCRPDETYALVGTAKDLTLNPRSCAGGFIHAYRIAELIDGGYKLEFVHKVSTCFPALLHIVLILPILQISSSSTEFVLIAWESCQRVAVYPNREPNVFLSDSPT